MNVQLTIAVNNGQLQLTGPIADVPMCLELLAEANRALAKMLREQSQQQADQQPHPRKLLFMPDGTIAATVASVRK